VSVDVRLGDMAVQAMFRRDAEGQMETIDFIAVTKPQCFLPTGMVGGIDIDAKKDGYGFLLQSFQIVEQDSSLMLIVLFRIGKMDSQVQDVIGGEVICNLSIKQTIAIEVDLHAGIPTSEEKVGKPGMMGRFPSGEGDSAAVGTFHPGKYARKDPFRHGFRFSVPGVAIGALELASVGQGQDQLSRVIESLLGGA
jgi:hypothetical protein